MSSAPTLDPPAALEPTRVESGVAAMSTPRRNISTIILIAACALSVGTSAYLWSKLSHIQETLTRQSADSAALSVEAKTLAKAAQDSVRDATARQGVLESRLSEVALQRSQLEGLMQSLSRSRDENMVLDIDSAVRLAQQQAQLTGSTEPLLAALKSADQRIARAALPSLNSLQRAIAKDIDRVKATAMADTPGLLVKLDELTRLIDELPLANALNAASAGKPALRVVPAAPSADSSTAPSLKASTVSFTFGNWSGEVWSALREEMKSLVRVRRINEPEAALLTPEQSFFVRENIKLKILNARLGLLARQYESMRSDVSAVSQLLDKYFQLDGRTGQASKQLIALVQQQMKSTTLPRIDDTLAALATAAAAK